MNETTLNLTIGNLYAITYRCRDLGNGIEEGEGIYAFDGRETLAGKLILTPEDASATLYLFDDEIVSVSEQDEPDDVWEYAERAPQYASATSDLWHWSTNYDAGKGPITLFLDLIGWSEENIGKPLYNLKDASLGYVELDKLAKALTEYTARPQDVREWVDDLLAFDES